MSTVYTLNKDDIILVVSALILPPLPVIVRKGLVSRDFWINLLLCLLFGFPGILHAVYVVYMTSSERSQYSRVDENSDLEAQDETAATQPAPKSAEPEVPPAYNDVAQNSNAAQAATDNKIQH
ncbi:LAME_0G04720g1_1 [Lachancea meyersii CBS 8951]|uniref:LAME_0G04720g1_1 n=1 Tax=Lachancea meyersii CBS 8951 TaxID=1266667 RepID=A0A1G4K722_9SACH|nr:LAME_0G04720g1_1 [Lachancea meyersii CBS 8951]